MSTAARIKHRPAPPDVHRKSVWDGLVLPRAGHGSTSLASGDSQQALGRGRRSDIADAAIDAIDMQPSATRQQGRSLESP